MACAHIHMNGNPGWLKPLRRLLERVEVKALFHSLDRSEKTDAASAHQELILSLLRCLSSPVTSQQALAVLADDCWAQVRSMAPIQSWTVAVFAR